VHIGSALSALMYLLPPVIKKLRAEHPGIDLVVSNAPTADMVNGVRQNTIDIALITLPVDDHGLEVVPLHIDEMTAIVPATARGIPDEVSPGYVAQQFLVLEIGAINALVTDWLSANGPLPQSTMTIATVEAVKAVVSSGLGMSILPKMAVANASDDIVTRPLNPPLRRTLGLIHHPKKVDDPAFRTVRDALMVLENIAPKARAKI
jgi:DNA-binding transcriptional LysR family regulator